MQIKFSDAEFEQSVIRMLVGNAVGIYLVIFDSFQVWWTVPYAVFMLISSVLTWHIYCWPSDFFWRKIAGQLLDLGCASHLIYYGGEVSVPIFGVYLWVILGNGFRFGLRYLVSALMISVTFFLIIAFSEPFWIEHKTLTLGVGITLLVVPVYFAILLHRLKKANQSLELISQHDELTGLLNRRAFDSKMYSEFSRLKRSPAPFALALIDIDNFKSVNDIYGHLVGDAVLRNIAGTIKNTCREIDIVARFGGEEFALLLPGHKENEHMPLAERIRRAVEKSVTPVGENSIQVTISIGLAYWSDQYDNIESWIQQADHALYSAKRQGRNKVLVTKGVVVDPYQLLN